MENENENENKFDENQLDDSITVNKPMKFNTFIYGEAESFSEINTSNKLNDYLLKGNNNNNNNNNLDFDFDLIESNDISFNSSQG